MATPKPGEIRCPTCHRSTPPAAFCTQCGSAIPSDARARPRGMDRDELQDRIRARRSGGDPYRRGGMADDEPPGYQRYEPDPTDAQARRPQHGDATRRDHLDEAAAAAPAPQPDLTRDRDEWARPASAPTAGAAPAPDWAPPPSDVPVEDGAPYEEPGYVDNFDDAAYDGDAYPYAYDEWTEPERKSGAGAFAILGFLALGVLALISGAVLAGIFDGGPTAGAGDATPTPVATAAATVAATPSPSAAATGSAGPSGSPGSSGGPIVFPDGFTAEAQPCLPGSASESGCASNGAVNGGAVDIWIGFQNGNGSDVIEVVLEAPDGTSVDQAIDLAGIGCGAACNGYTWFGFSNLEPGNYVVQVSRNGEPAGSTTFEVS